MTRFKILVSDPLADAGLNVLRSGADVDLRARLRPDELRALLPGYEALIVRSETKVTADLLAAGAALRVVTRAGVGIDNVDVEAATERGILVLNTPGPNAIAAAEHTLGLLLALLRHIPRANASAKAGRWDRQHFVGNELYRKTLGILGLGRIGREVALRARAFGMDVVTYDPFVPASVAESVGARALSFEALLERADVVTLHLPLIPETAGLLGANELARLKAGAFVVNCARGGLIDETALAAELASGRLGGAALDVFALEPPTDSPLLQLDNVVVTPHLAASSVEAQHGVALAAAESTLAALRGEIVENAVNLPGLAPGTLAALRPWLDLATHMGRLLAATLDDPAVTFELSFLGDAAGVEPRLIGTAALSGFLRAAVPEQVTLVNARLLAARRGLTVSERFTTTREPTPLVFAVCASSSGASQDDEHRHSVSGSLTEGGEARIVAIDGFAIDLDPAGRLILIHHHDRPGMIGAVGTLLGAVGINIAGMQVGRWQIRGSAVMIVQLDDPLPRATLESIRRIPGLSHAHYVDLAIV